MWLPASYFNRAINYESISRFGTKRKHKINLTLLVTFQTEKEELVPRNQSKGSTEAA